MPILVRDVPRHAKTSRENPRTADALFLGFACSFIYTRTCILDDPTLGMNVIDPPTSVSCGGGSLTWTASEDTNEYYVYHAADMESTFTNYFGSGSVTGTSVTLSSCSGVFMVRAAKEVTTGTATYLNLSQGAFSQ